MKDESKIWLSYAKENLTAAQILLTQSLYNPCLQNVQQSIEKGLKALLLEKDCSLRKTHSITDLVRALSDIGVQIQLNDDDCDLLDSIYLPSKYPLGGVLPDFEPDKVLCHSCLLLAETVFDQVTLELVDATN
jgi:HEPN domain-containing protein